MSSSTAPAPAMFDDDGVRVHFDDACVLIPDPVVQSRMPRLVKKSYSLPLWRKRSNSQSPLDDPQLAASPPSEHSGVSFTVSVPSFAKSRSPTRGEHVHAPLVSCLLNSPNSPRIHRHARRPSLPSSPPLDAVTVPLRPCCPECYPITEESLREGDDWKEKFTRAARRRRNSSADSHAHSHVLRHRRVCDNIPGFGAIVSVDEVDKRRGVSSADAPVSPAAVSEDPAPTIDTEEGLLPSISRRGSSNEPPPPIEEVAEEDPFPPPVSLQAGPSTSRLPPLPRRGVPLFLERLEDARTQGSTEEGLARESVYYTPLESPAIPPWGSPSVGSKDSSPEVPTPDTPPTPSPSQAIPIPTSGDHKSAFISNLSLSSFEFVHHPERSSPDVDAVAALPDLATSPSKRRLHMPNIPGPGSFLRVGAEMFKGVGAMSSGNLALSV